MPNAAAARYHETFASFFRPCPGTTNHNVKPAFLTSGTLLWETMRRNTTVVSNASLSTSKFRVSLNSAGKVPSDMIHIFLEVPFKQKKIYLGHGCPIWHRSSSSSAPFHWPNPPGGFSRKDLKSIQQNLSPTTSGTERVDLLSTWIDSNFFFNFRRFTTLNC